MITNMFWQTGTIDFLNIATTNKVRHNYYILLPNSMPTNVLHMLLFQQN